MPRIVWPRPARRVCLAPGRPAIVATALVGRALTASSCGHCAAICAEVEHGKSKGDDDQDVGGRGTLAEVELDERKLVRLGGDRLRRVRWATAGESEDDVDHLQRVDDAENEDDVDHRAQEWPGDVA